MHTLCASTKTSCILRILCLSHTLCAWREKTYFFWFFTHAHTVCSTAIMVISITIPHRHEAHAKKKAYSFTCSRVHTLCAWQQRLWFSSHLSIFAPCVHSRSISDLSHCVTYPQNACLATECMFSVTNRSVYWACTHCVCSSQSMIIGTSTHTRNSKCQNKFVLTIP